MIRESLAQNNSTLPPLESGGARLDKAQVDELAGLLAPGTRLDAHYVITRLLGSGGMGVVLLARDERLMRDVAIKFVSPALLTQPGSQQRFLDEARAMARVRHPNVVEVFTFGEHLGKPYFVMEYVPGITADTWFRERMLRTQSPPPVDEALGIIEQICRGASAIHTSGAIHGDLKPGNVLLGPAFRVALADLGLSRALDRGESAYTAGTPAYMAPEAAELCSDPALLRRQDVYSLGVMAYEFLTGHLPRPPGLNSKTAARVLPPLPPSQLRSELPSVFDAVLLSALAIEPSQRTDSVDSLRRDLMRARRVASERKFAAKVLVVDDDADFLALVDRSLRASFPGAQITCVADGARALDELERRPYDLCIFDLRLPDLNGVELTATVRAEQRHRNTPILIVTAHGGGRDWQLLSAMGADGFLVKPVDPHALSAMVGRMLELRKSAR
jgi:serine/threonine protein kinase